MGNDAEQTKTTTPTNYYRPPALLVMSIPIKGMDLMGSL
jgi:hypothetical protein